MLARTGPDPTRPILQIFWPDPTRPDPRVGSRVVQLCISHLCSLLLCEPAPQILLPSVFVVDNKLPERGPPGLIPSKKSSDVHSRGPYYTIDPRVLQIDGDNSTRISSSDAAGSSVMRIGANITPRQPNSALDDERTTRILHQYRRRLAPRSKNNDETTYAYRSPATIDVAPNLPASGDI